MLNARDGLWTDTLDGRVGSDVAMIDLVGRLRDSYRNVTLV